MPKLPADAVEKRLWEEFLKEAPTQVPDNYGDFNTTRLIGEAFSKYLDAMKERGIISSPAGWIYDPEPRPKVERQRVKKNQRKRK